MVERDHELQNPTSADKIALLGGLPPPDEREPRARYRVRQRRPGVASRPRPRLPRVGHRRLRPRGSAAIGEPFWRQWPLPDGVDPGTFVSLADTVARGQAGYAVTGVIAASENDWDRYESLHWRAIEEWLTEHPGNEGGAELRAQHERYRRDYLAFKRALLGSAIFVGRTA